MSNVINFVKKAFTVGVVSSTILWSSMVATLLPVAANAATCPTLSPGDMIKVEGKAAIYAVNNENKVLYFPSGDEFKSWRENYGGYFKVSQACFDSLMVPSTYPGAVNFRSGSYVVKRPSSDQLYVVEPGNTLAKITPEAAKALYGTGYKVMTVADAFWPHYVNNPANGKGGADVTEGKPHPGMLVMNGGKTWYVDTDMKLREVSATGMTANMFMSKFVHLVTDSMISGLTQGDKIDAEVKALTDKTQSGGVQTPAPGPTPTSTPVVGGTVTVSLAADNPAARTIASGSAFNAMLKLNVSAAGAAKVTGLKLTKLGFAANTAVNGLLVVDQTGKQYGNTVSSLNADGTANLLFSSDPIVLAAGETKTLTVKYHAATSPTSGTIGFKVVAATDVTSDGTVGGTFPVVGNEFTIVDGSTSLPTVTVNLQATPGNTTVNLDTKDQEAYKVKVTETTSNEDVVLDKLVLYNAGTAADTDFKDVKLQDQDGSVLATAQPVNRYVTFSGLNKTVLKGNNRMFTVVLTVVSGSSRTIRLTQQNDYDMVVKGATTGAYVLPTATGGDTAFPVGDAANLLTMASGSLTLQASGTPTTNLSIGETGVTLGRFLITPKGEDMELRTVGLGVVWGGTVALTGNLYVKVDGNIVWSGAASGIATTTNALANSATLTSKTLSTYPILKAGKDAVVEITGDISTSATASDSYAAVFDVTSVKRLNTNDIATISVSQVSPSPRTVSTLALSNQNVTFAAGTYNVVRGTQQAKLAKVSFSAASSGEDLRLSKIGFTVATTTASGAYADITNLRLYADDSTTPVDVTAAPDNAATLTFTLSQPVVIKKSDATPKTYWLKGDISNAATTGTVWSFTHTVANGITTATGNVSGQTATISTATGSAQPTTISAGGTLTVMVDYGTGNTASEEKLVKIASKDVQMTVFKFRAYDEDVKVRSLTLTATGSAAFAATDLKNVRIYKDSDTTPLATLDACTVSGSAGSCAFTSSDQLFVVPSGQTVLIRAKADIGAEGSAKLGNGYRFVVQAVGDITALGSAGTLAAGSKTTLADASTYTNNTTIVPFDVTLSGSTPSEGSSATQAVGTGFILGKFKVANSGSAPIYVYKTKTIDNGSNVSTTATYSMFDSTNGGTDLATSVTTSVKASNYLFNGTFTPSSSVQGGTFKTYSVKVANGTGFGSGDSWQLSVNAINDWLYSVLESEVGYDANADGDMTDEITGLKMTGRPNLGSFIKS